MQALARSSHLIDAAPTDATLLARVGGGDAAAFERLYDRYRAIAQLRAWRYCRNAADAEEIVQDAFVNVWRSAAAYDPARGSVRNWIMAVVTRRTIDGYRRSRCRVTERSLVGLEGEVIADGDTHLEAEANERKQAVRGALAALPLDQRRVLALAYYVGLSHSEIAATTLEPLGTVKGRIRLGHVRMRKELGETSVISEGDGRQILPPRIDFATAASPGCGGRAF